MSNPELAHLELLAEVDSLLSELTVWSDRAPDWPVGRQCRALIQRLVDRSDTLRVRLEAPLVVATLGGTGTGKSALVNALVGHPVTEAGRQRPTTRQPILICRPDLTPQQLGIDPAAVHVVHDDSPTLRDLVLLDCPDPDTTEDVESAATNLARLHQLLPHCDVLLVTGTQQKYRSARVLSELAAAAPGARLVFVATHADSDDDIRDDWRRVLEEHYRPGEILRVDSLAALDDAQSGLAPRGDFARLVDLLTRELAGAAGNRIRRANFLDLIDATLRACRQRIADARPKIDELDEAIAEQRLRLAARMSAQMRTELLNNHRPWESRLLTEVASHWGYSPFSLLLRAYQGLGGLLSGAALMRVRTPAQLALWGAFEGGRVVRRFAQSRQAEESLQRAVAWSWDEGELRTAAIIIDGYALEAGLPRSDADSSSLARQATAAAESFLSRASSDLQQVVARMALRHVGWFTRLRYEFALLALLALLLYRLGRNFFYDSWVLNEPVYGFDFLLVAGFWFVLWCALLLWAYTGRLRRGLRAEVSQLAENWNSARSAEMLFADQESACRDVERFAQGLDQLEQRVQSLLGQVGQPSPRLGHLMTEDSQPSRTADTAS